MGLGLGLEIGLGLDLGLGLRLGLGSDMLGLGLGLDMSGLGARVTKNVEVLLSWPSNPDHDYRPTRTHMHRRFVIRSRSCSKDGL